MAELAPLSILITADADDLKAELAAAKTALANFEKQAAKGSKNTTKFGGALGALGNVSREAKGRIQLVSFQLQDIAVQLQAGTRASTVFAQQLPQLASAFGATGAAIGVLAAVGIPALAFAFSDAETEVSNLEEALGDLDTAMSTLDTSSNIALASLEDLRRKYGANAEAVRELYRELVAVNQQQALNAMNASIIAAGEEINGLTSALGDFSDARRELLQAQDLVDIGLGPLPSELKAMEDAVAAASKRLQDEFGLTSAQAYRIVEALQAVDSAAGPEQAAAAAQQLASAISSAAAEGANLSEAMAGAASASARAFAAFSSALRKGKEVVAEMNNVNVGDGWQFNPLTDMPPPLKTDPSGGGGGGGRGAQDRTEAELEALQKALMSREELEIASFERQQETLQAALEKKLLTQQEYNALMEETQQAHSDKMAGIDAYRYGDTLQATGQFMGDMAKALQSGNDKMAKIAQVFAASETLINAWRAYSQTLADPSLPFFAKIPAALSVLSAGMGAVQAIKGAGGGGGGGAGAAGAGAAAAAAPQQPGQNIVIDFQGDTFSRQGGIALIEQINDAIRSGGRIEGVMAR